MDEGDEYVPNMATIGSGDQGNGPGGGGGGGSNGQQQPPPGTAPPPNPYHNPYQQMHPGMHPGMPPPGMGMMSPHHMQHMSMQNPYMNLPQQPPQPPVPPPAPAPKKRQRKKAGEAPAQPPPPQAAQPPQGMDPMQRMAAMAYGGQPPQMSGYPGYAPPQQQYRPPPGYSPHPQMYPGHPGMAPGQQPPPGQPSGQAPAASGGGGARAAPPAYPPPGMYPPQGYPGYPGYPPHPQMAQAMRYPMHHPYYMENPYGGYPPQQPQQMRPGQGGENGGWTGGQTPMPNPYAQPGEQGGGPPGGGQMKMSQQAQTEAMQIQQHLHRLYASPRTPQIEQEIPRLEQRLAMLQQMQAASSSGEGTTGIVPHPQQFAPPPGGATGGYPPGFPAPPSREGPMHHMGSPPVSVTGGTGQIQVNIKPEQAGHTLISVYHGMGPEGYPKDMAGGGAGHPKSADSVPPEPTPSMHMQSQQQASNMPLDPYGITARQQQHQHQMQQQQHSMQSPHSMGGPHSAHSTPVPTPTHAATPGQPGSVGHHQMGGPSSMSTPSEMPPMNGVPSHPPHPQQSPVLDYGVGPSTSNAPSSCPSPPHASSVPPREEPPKEEKMEGEGEESKDSKEENGEDDGMDAFLDEPPRAPAPAEMTEEEEEMNGEREEEEKEETPPEENGHSRTNGDASPVIEDQPSTSQESEEKEEEKETETEEEEKKEDTLDEDDSSTQPAMEVDDGPVVKQEEEEPLPPSPKKAKGSRKVKKEPTEMVLPAALMAVVKAEASATSSREDSLAREGSMESSSTSFPVSEDHSLASTPAPAAKGKGKKKAAATPKGGNKSAKKRKASEESDEDDGDFVMESKKSKKKKVVVVIEEIKEEFPMELVEKRRSGRTKATIQRYEDDERDDHHAAEVIRELDLMEEAENSQLVDEGIGPYFVPENIVVDKILNMREKDGREEFLCKYKGRAYVHCEWHTQEELEETDKRVGAKVKRFRVKKQQASFMDLDDEDFNPDFCIVERVLAVETEGEQEIALVKWKSLPYDESTWETLESVPEDKVELWRGRQIIDSAKAKEKARPEPHHWKKLEKDAEWKDGNKLREYQFEGVDWLLNCYHYQQNCILADEMGLGKTVQTITFLSRVWDYGIHGPFLIVVPLSTVHNWMREFETWTDMNVIVYHGSAKSRDILQHYEFFYQEPPEDDPNYKNWHPRLMKLDAIITTFEMVVTDVEVLKRIPFRLCVIDEAHRLKNRNCKLLTGGLASFRMEHRVLLTGTPLQNNIEELFSLLNFLHPAQFSSPIAFLEQFGQCQTDEQVQKLQEILKPMMLRRLKEDVEKTLKPREETIVEVQLSDTQKKYYRAILERNFSHLCKGTANAPALMNVMMELRKCCNHPFLIQGAEEQINSEFKLMHPDWEEDHLQHRSLVLASGKMVLIEKLLPKLKQDGHKVLIFSQMVKVLDLIEEFLVGQKYTFERIDGNVRGDMRQAAIDRFSKKDADRFVFLLCTRAGGLGINLTAADTVIIFDSDWNPQNDLQAQARCHRIGQTKTVKVYRLVTANTYEREMFEKASLKLGLDKAVLQSTHALRDQSSQLSKKDVEELLKKGAYGSILDDDAEGSKFNEEDIDTILQRRTTTITLEAGVKGSTFSKATFNASHNDTEIDIDDPNFWSKWAMKANVDAERALAGEERELIVSEPRQRKKRFEPAEAEADESDDSSDSGGRGRNKKKNERDRKKRRGGGDEDADYINYRPDELAFNKSEYFKVEKQLGIWSWGRWAQMKENGDMEVTELDIQHMARTLLLHCLREFRGDDRTKEFIWKLIHPSTSRHHRLSGRSNLLIEGWAALPEYNPPNFALDTSFQRHVHRHANKLLTKIELLWHLEDHMLGTASKEKINAGKDHSEISVTLQSLTDVLCEGWNDDCDKSLIIGCYRHGFENVENCVTDDKLVFASIDDVVRGWPTAGELQARTKRLVAASLRQFYDPEYKKPNWNRAEEKEFVRSLRALGIMDGPSADSSSTTAMKMSWKLHRKLCPLLEKKSDDEMMELLYCVLAMCSRVQGTDSISPLDQKRSVAVEAMTLRKTQKLLARIQLMRKLHAQIDKAASSDSEKEKYAVQARLVPLDHMPTGWTAAHDLDLLEVVHEIGFENISPAIQTRPLFQNLIRPDEKALMRRVVEIVATVDTGKWTGKPDISIFEDSDDERKTRSDTGRSPATTASARRGRSNATADKDKMRQLLQTSLLQKQLEDQMGGSLGMMLGMLQASMGTNSRDAQQAQNALLASLFMPTPTASTSSSAASQAAQLAQMATLLQSIGGAGAGGLQALEEAMNLCKKETERQAAEAAKAAAAAQAEQAARAAQAQLAGLASLGSIGELLRQTGLPPDTKIPMVNTKTKQKLHGETAPALKEIDTWMASHPDYQLDLSGAGPTPSTPAKAAVAPSPGPSSGTSTPRPSTANATTSKAATPAPPAAPSPKLEPGEIPKAAATASVIAGAPISVPSTSATPSSSAPSSSAAAAATAASTAAMAAMLGDPPVPVCNKSSGALLPQSQWPSLSKINTHLDSHPDHNIHHTGLSLVLPVISSAHSDRVSLTTETKAALEQQMQLMVLQQSMLANPLALMGMGMSSSKQDEAALQQQLLLAMMSNPSALGGLSMDQSLLLALGGASGLSGLSSLAAPSTPSRSAPKAAAPSKAKAAGKLSAVLEKLSSNQS